MSFKKFQKHLIIVYQIMMTSVLIIVLMGVCSYLFLMAFYATNHNWAAPLVLSAAQQKVLAYQPLVTGMEAVLRQNKADLTVAEQKRAIADGPIASINARITRSGAALANQTDEKTPMVSVQAATDKEIARQSVEQLRAAVQTAEHILNAARQSPYYLALIRSVPVAFVPYDNLPSAQPGAPVYDCYLEVVLCRQVGSVTHVYDAEEYGLSPLFRNNVKGKFVGVSFSRMASSESALVFIGHKPLLF